MRAPTVRRSVPRPRASVAATSGGRVCGSVVVVRHTAAAVAYDARLLLSGCRRDQVSLQTKRCLADSSNLLLRHLGDVLLLTDVLPPEGAQSARPRAGRPAAGAPRAAVFDFLSSLRAALQLAHASDVAQLLCVAPNLVDVPRALEPKVVLRQIDAMGVPEATGMLAAAYPTRLQLLAITGRLRSAAPPEWAQLPPRAFVARVALAWTRAGCGRAATSSWAPLPSSSAPRRTTAARWRCGSLWTCPRRARAIGSRASAPWTRGASPEPPSCWDATRGAGSASTETGGPRRASSELSTPQRAATCAARHRPPSGAAVRPRRHPRRRPSRRHPSRRRRPPRRRTRRRASSGPPNTNAAGP
eukprot:567213-Prymnesium_polylepis.1